MRRAIQTAIIFALVLLAAQASHATTITISSTQVQNFNYVTGATSATLRIWANQSFVDSAGNFILGGGVGNLSSVNKSVTCVVVAGVVTIPGITLTSTTDSLDNPTVTWTAKLYDQNGTPRDTFLANFRLPASITPTTWADIRLYNISVPKVPPLSFYTTDQFNFILSRVFNTATKLNESTFGVGKSRTAPQDAANPTVIEVSDPVVTSRIQAALLSFAAGVAAQGSTKTTFTISTVMTISASVSVPANLTLEFTNTGQLSVSSGQVVSVLGPIIAPPDKQIFAGAGKVSLAGNTAQRTVWANWYGLNCAKGADDSVGLNYAIKSAWTQKEIRVTPRCQMRLDNQILVDGTDVSGNTGGRGLILDGGDAFHTSDYIPPSLYWAGSAGLSMIRYNNVPAGIIRGFTFDASNAPTVTAGAWIEISKTNAEGDFLFERNVFNNNNFIRQTTDAVTNGTTTVTSATGAFTAGDVGHTIYLNNGVLYHSTYITARASATSITVAVAPSFSSTGVTMNLYNDNTDFKGIYVVGQEHPTYPWNSNNENVKIRNNQLTCNQLGDALSTRRGAGVYQGNNQNSRMLTLTNNWFTYCSDGLHQLNGDLDASDNFMASNGVDYRIAINLPSSIRKTNSEGSRQFLVGGAGAPLSLSNNFADGSNSVISGKNVPLIDLQGGSAILTVTGNVFEFPGVSAINNVLRVYGNASQTTLHSVGNQYPNGSMTKLGFDQMMDVTAFDSADGLGSFTYRNSRHLNTGTLLTIDPLLNSNANLASGSMTAGNATLTSLAGFFDFTAADVGKNIWVTGAGYAGNSLATTVATFVDAQHVTLTDQALTSVTGQSFGLGSNSKPFLQVSTQYAPGLVMLGDASYAIQMQGQLATAFHDAGNSGTAKTINFNDGNFQKVTLNGSATLTFTNPYAGAHYIFELVQDATGSRAVTWPANVKWPGGVSPALTTTATKKDKIVCDYDGTNYLCVSFLNY